MGDGVTYFKEVPSFKVLLYICLGIIVGNFYREYFDQDHILVLGTFILLLSCIIFFSSYKNLLFSTLTSITFFLLGISAIYYARPLHYLTHYAHQENSHLVAEGQIVTEPAKNKRLRLMLNIKKIYSLDGYYRTSSGNILTYIDIDSASSQLQNGDKILINTDYYPLQTNQNPLAFDFKSYLYYQGVEHQCFIKSGEWHKINEPPEFNISVLSQYLRQQCYKIFENKISNPDNLAILSAMILGLRNNLSEDIYKAYTDTGSVHILAVSGMHVGIVNSLFLIIFGLLIPAKYTRLKMASVLISILLIWLFALITGAAPAVLRAAAMFSLLSLGTISARRKNTYNILGASAIALLCYDPNLLFSGSFQFSYLALFSILYFQPKLLQIIPLTNKFFIFFANLILVAVAAQVLVFPITIYYFHKFAVSFFISGIVAILMAFAIIYMGVFLLAFENVASFIPGISAISDGVAYYLDLLLSVFIYCIKLIQSLPFSSIDDIYFEFYEVVIMYTILILSMLWISFRYKKAIYPILILLIIWVGGHIRQTTESQGQCQFICYDVQKALAVDFVNGRKMYSLATENEDDKLLRFARDTYRMSLNINDKISLDSTNVMNHSIIKNGGLIQFLDKTIAIAHEGYYEWTSIKEIDYLLVGQVNTYTFHDIIRDKNIKHIIVNHYMNNYKITPFLEELRQWHPSVSYVGESAVIINMKDHE